MRRLVISSSPGETRAAVLFRDRVIALKYLRDEGRLAGALFAARVARLAPELDLAFLTLPKRGEAILPRRYAHHLAKVSRPKAIGDCVAEGDLITVKILQDAFENEDKLAVASARLTRAERALGEGKKAPATLRPAPPAADALVDWGLRFHINEVHFDEADSLFSRRTELAASDIDLRLTGPEFFAACGAEEAVEAALEDSVPLPSGGNIRIDETHAGVMIDVNSGRGRAGLASQAVRQRTNLEAAEAVAAQILLRNLSGLIVIDFLDVGGRRDAARLLAALDGALEGDPLPVERTGLSRLSVVEIARKRTGLSLARTLLRPRSPAATVETRALELLRRLCKEGGSGAGELECSVDHDVNDWLKARPKLVEEVNRKSGRPVRLIVSDGAAHSRNAK